MDIKTLIKEARIWRDEAYAKHESYDKETEKFKREAALAVVEYCVNFEVTLRHLCKHYAKRRKSGDLDVPEIK